MIWPGKPGYINHLGNSHEQVTSVKPTQPNILFEISTQRNEQQSRIVPILNTLSQRTKKGRIGRLTNNSELLRYAAPFQKVPTVAVNSLTEILKLLRS